MPSPAPLPGAAGGRAAGSLAPEQPGAGPGKEFPRPPSISEPATKERPGWPLAAPPSAPPILPAREPREPSMRPAEAAHRGHRAAAGPARAGPHGGGARPLLHPDAGRLGRRGHQDRDPDRRHRAQLRRLPQQGHGLGLPRHQPQQAGHRHRPEIAGGRRGAAAADPDCRCAGHQYPPRRHGPAGLRAGAVPGAEPAAGLRGRHRLRPGRPAPRPAGLRRDHPGRLRLRRHRRRGPMASRCSCPPWSPTRSPAWRCSRRCWPRSTTARGPARASWSRCRCWRR